MRLNKDDLYFVVTCVPEVIRKVMMNHPIYLGGGFIRDIIAGNNPSDIDLFGPSKEEIGRAIERLKNEVRDIGIRQPKFRETANAITILMRGFKPIQFITRWLYDNPRDVVSSFDFTIAQAAVFVDKPGDSLAWSSIVSDHFYADLASKRLRYTYPERDEDAGGSMLRVVKFLRRGYNISPEDLGGVIARLLHNIDMDSWLVEQGEEARAAVVTSILREVDPLAVFDGIEFRAEVGEIDKELKESKSTLEQDKKPS